MDLGRPCPSQRDQCISKLPIFRSAQRQQHHTREALPQPQPWGRLPWGRLPCHSPRWDRLTGHSRPHLPRHSMPPRHSRSQLLPARTINSNNTLPGLPNKNDTSNVSVGCSFLFFQSVNLFGHLMIFTALMIDQCISKLPVFRSAQREQHHTREALPQSA